ncbi:DUF4198 domain-containing protein [Emcibacter sp.]|uniref:DUF4198 domain-containing protein n=1 Tax=Emcibacter sp. TaxID=1979954 RepID=UPI003A9003F4
MSLLIRTTLISLMVFFTTLASAQAHRFWLLPSTFTLSGEQEWITVDAAISNNLFFSNHVAPQLADLHVTAPDGSPVEKNNGMQGKMRTTFDVELKHQGTYRIADRGDMYFVMWKENGETLRRRGSLEQLKGQGLHEKQDARFMQVKRRVESYVTLGAPSTDIFKAEGDGIEIQPVTHPNDVFTGEEVSFLFLKDGKAAEGLEVTLIRGQDRYRNDEQALKLKTDKDGKISFTLTEAGRYWLSTGHRGQNEKVDGLDLTRVHSYVLTFEALQP